MNKPLLTSALVIAGLYMSPASAAQYDVALTDVWLGSGGLTARGVLSGDLTGTYDDNTGIVTMNGTTSVAVEIASLPPYPIYAHVHSDWSTGNGGYSASAYNCIEGDFGDFLNINICGGYDFGPNFSDESSVDYTTIPGSLILGGDDFIISPQMQGSAYTTTEAFFDGANLIMNSASWTGGVGTDSPDGIQLRFDATQLPGSDFDTLFGTSSSADELSIIDLDTGTAELVGILDSGSGNFATPVSMAARPSDGELFVWNNSNSNVPSNVPSASLLTVDRCTGRAVNVDTNTPFSDLAVGGLGFDANGTLYGTGRRVANAVVTNTLEIIDPVTGVATMAAELTPNVTIAGLDLGPNGQLYGAELNAGSQRLFTIDTATGVMTEVATLSQDMGILGSIVFDPNGQLIGTSLSGPAGADLLFDIDLATGGVSNIRQLPLVPVPGNVLSALLPQGMAFSAACEVVDDSILGIFEAAVADGTLVGTGNSNAAAIRLGKMRDLLEEAAAALDAGMLADACDAYEAAADKVDGIQPPPDYVEGAAASELFNKINSERFALGCIQISG